MKTHLGHYEILSELGRGGMGVVYRGYEPSLARYVAIKELSPSLAGEPQVVERFLREARSMAVLNDPHIIQIYSIGLDGDQPFFVMEFVDGISVASLIQKCGFLSPDDAMKIVHQTAQGLLAAHDRGVIHRDIKPANLMISQRGQVKIADFGIALANHDMSAKLTSAGDLVGTPGYLSPEILLGEPVDQRSDMYALGVVLFEMLTGRTPFSEASVYKLMLTVVENEVPDVREIKADIDPGVAAILSRMLAKVPAKRYQGMHELISDLEKHPLITRGGPLKVQLALVNTSGETLVGFDPSAQPHGARRASTPAPAMSNIPQVASAPRPPGVAAAVAAPAAAITPANPGVPTERRTRPGLGASAPTPAVAVVEARPARRLPWGLLFFSLVALGLLAGAWIWRAALVAAMPGLLHGLSGLHASGVKMLRPLLRQLGVGLSAEWVFNALLVLLAILLMRSITFRIGRARARRAYARGARRTA